MDKQRKRGKRGKQPKLVINQPGGKLAKHDQLPGKKQPKHDLKKNKHRGNRTRRRGDKGSKPRR